MRFKKELDFIIIGAMKSGTTSVHKYLSAHKKIFLPPEKEAPFFSEDEIYELGYDKYFSEFFSLSNKYTLHGTVTPQYMLSTKAAERIRKTCPNVKLIAILRDPIERAYSHYHMATRVWNEKRTFNDAMTLQISEGALGKSRNEPDYYGDYVVFGEYGRILSNYHSLFSTEQLLVLYMSDLNLNPDDFMRRIFNFVGVEMPNIPNLGKKYHSSKINPFLSYLAEISFNSRLRKIGKLLPRKYRRRISFWLSLYRSTKNNDLNTDFILSKEIRKELEVVYRKDAVQIEKITGEKPEWIRKWDEDLHK